jgi:hypothetical protein
MSSNQMKIHKFPYFLLLLLKVLRNAAAICHFKEIIGSMAMSEKEYFKQNCQFDGLGMGQPR